MTEPLERLDEADLGRKGITGYRPGGFRVGKTWHDGHLLLLPTGVASWPIETIDDVSEESLAPLRDLQPPAEILLLGLGTKAPLVAFELRQALADCGLSVEAMPTPSACRTFNVLLAEERRVVAALLAMP